MITITCLVSHYNDVIMCAIASQTTSPTIVYSTVYWSADQRQHQSSASLIFVRGIHRSPVIFPHKWPVTRKMFSFDDIIMWRVSTLVTECSFLQLGLFWCMFHDEAMRLVKLLHSRWRNLAQRENTTKRWQYREVLWCKFVNLGTSFY